MDPNQTQINMIRSNSTYFANLHDSLIYKFSQFSIFLCFVYFFYSLFISLMHFHISFIFMFFSVLVLSSHYMSKIHIFRFSSFI